MCEILKNIMRCILKCCYKKQKVHSPPNVNRSIKNQSRDYNRKQHHTWGDYHHPKSHSYKASRNAEKHRIRFNSLQNKHKRNELINKLRHYSLQSSRNINIVKNSNSNDHINTDTLKPGNNTPQDIYMTPNIGNSSSSSSSSSSSRINSIIYTPTQSNIIRKKFIFRK